jgi:hypothetical protein
VVSSGRSITALGRKLGLHDSVLRRWVVKFRQERTSVAPRQKHSHRQNHESQSAHGTVLEIGTNRFWHFGNTGRSKLVLLENCSKNMFQMVDSKKNSLESKAVSDAFRRLF